MTRKRTRETSSFEMTPLVDVVFLLLIFFMVSSVFKKEELALMLDLPGTEAADDKKQAKTLVIELDQAQVAINGAKMLLKDVDGLLSGVGDKRSPVDLRVDSAVTYDRVMKLIDKLKQYGLTNLSLVSDSAD